jgi:chromosome segregation protein
VAPAAVFVSPPATALSPPRVLFMHIRKLELHGFKSFPDRTTFHFGAGISGVVGPNGCGKSNIVDAIKWCLGEQSAKSLRGQAMADIIFAGSTDRKPTNSSEVSVHFAAGDEPFPGEWSQHTELAITRRLFRDGNSVYLINNQKVRLRDIQDLFLDSGVANRLYSFIEQGRIGEIVNAKPEQRRSLIEEAAGISRYKARRTEAEGKLGTTLENSERVGDAVARLGKRMRSLERQVVKAMRYRRLRSYVRQGELHLGLCRYAGLVGDRRALSGKLRAAEAAEAEITLDVQRRETSLKEVRASANALEAQAAVIRDEGAEVEASRREREQARKYHEREHGELVERIGVLGVRGEESARSRDAAAGRLAEAEKERDDVQSRVTAIEAELDEARADVRSAEGTVRERRRRIDQAKAAVLDRAKALARARAEIDAGRLRVGDLDARSNRLEQQRDASEAELNALATAIQVAEAAVSSAETRHEEAAGSLARAQSRRDEIRQTDQAARAAVRTTRSALFDAERAVTRLTTRVESLAAVVEGDEGADGAIKAALAVDGVLGRLGGVLSAPESLDAPLSTALRELLDAVVVRDASTAVAVSEATNGRVDVVVGREGELSGPLAGVGGAPIAVGALASLLEGCQAAASIPDALALWEQSGTPVLVTGDVPAFVDPRGVLRLGPPGGGGAVLLARRRDLIAAREKMAAVEQSCELARGAHEASVAAAQQAEAGLEAAREAAAMAHQTERDAAQSLRDAERELSDGRRRLGAAQGLGARLTQERAEIAQSRVDLGERATSLASQIVRDEAEQDRVEKVLQTEQVALMDEGRALGQVRDGLATRAADAAGLRERLVGLDRTRAEVRSAHQAAASLAESCLAESEAARVRIEELTTLDGQLALELDSLRRKELELSEALAAAREKVQSRRATLGTAEEELSQARASREAATTRRNDLDRAAQQVKQDLSRIREDVQERYKLSIVALLDRVDRMGHVVLAADPGARREDLPEAALPTDRDREITQDVRVTLAMLEDPVVRTHWEAELEEARQALTAVGEVNLVALTEYEEVGVEHAELDQQREDLEASVHTIRQTIARLNRISRERFRDTFERVNEWFEEIYPKLVGGGQARLQLTNEEDMLETGVDIFVEPPGKRLQNLSLLSGGETAMVAIALIFSLFRVKPSPFCLLDEVDAPLDESNGARFNMMLRDMAELSQFILVTHNKKTMECADTLYGVTMPTPGVSRLVSVRLE